MSLGPLEIIGILLVILLLFGYKKLPDASRSLGRSLRIFKGEMKGMKDDGRVTDSPAPPVVQGTVVDGGAVDRVAEAPAPVPDPSR